MPVLKFATRPSKLARWQTNHVINSLKPQFPNYQFEEKVMSTKGDRNIDQPLPEIGGKGLFTLELEQALLRGEVDAVVHSMKDLPVDDSAGQIIAAIPERANPHDVLISPNNYTIKSLPENAVVGTSSLRRQAQLLTIRPDLTIKPIRGNIDTRIRKVQDGDYDAIVLAAAGVERLGLAEDISHELTFDLMLPAPGQGALAVQCRADDQDTQAVLSKIDHPETRRAVETERHFLSKLQGGCSLPVGAHAQIKNGYIHMQTIVLDENGQRVIRVEGEAEHGFDLAEDLANQAFQQGAAEVLNV